MRFFQRQLEWLLAGSSVAFGSGVQDGVFAKGNQNGSQQEKLLLQQQKIKKKLTVGPNANGPTAQRRKMLGFKQSRIINQLIAIRLTILCRRLPLSLVKDTAEIHRILIAQAVSDLGDC